MPTRKQRRRREKGRRHEYEYVYVDDEGHEVEPPPDAVVPAPKERSAARSSRGSQSANRPRRGPREPSLKRSAAWAIGFAVVLMLVTRSLFAALIYGVFLFFIMNLTERMVYRRYLRRSGQLPEAPAGRAKPPAAAKSGDEVEPAASRRSPFRR